MDELHRVPSADVLQEDLYNLEWARHTLTEALARMRRDYFVAESPSGEVAWIFRDHRRGTDDGEWFVHGIFA